MPEPVLVALITAGGVIGSAIILAIVGPVIIAKLNETIRLGRATAHQVKNDHKSNLRDDIDDIKKLVVAKHGETRGWFDSLRLDVNDLRSAMEENTDRIEDLEDTHDARKQ